MSCARCESVLSYDSAKGGTSHLRRHADACNEKKTGTPSVASFFKSASVPKAAKDYVTGKCVDFVCKDIRPYNVESGPAD